MLSWQVKGALPRPAGVDVSRCSLACSDHALDRLGSTLETKKYRWLNKSLVHKTFCDRYVGTAQYPMVPIRRLYRHQIEYFCFFICGNDVTLLTYASFPQIQVFKINHQEHVVLSKRYYANYFVQLYILTGWRLTRNWNQRPALNLNKKHWYTHTSIE